jgi:hypothetical protein
MALGWGLVGGLCLVLHEPNPSPSLAGTVFLIVMGSGVVLLLTVGGTYGLVGALRHRLTIRGDCVESVAAFSTRQIRLSEVDEVRWQFAGGLVLKSSSCKLKIDLSLYSRQQTRELIGFFRLQLPESIQTGWNRFWRIKWRLFDDPDPARREQFVAKTRALHRRLLAWFLAGGVAIVAVTIVVWHYTGSWSALVGLPVLMVLATTVLAVRADCGKVADKFDLNLRLSPILLAGLISFLLFVPISVTFAAFDLPGGKVLFFTGSGFGYVLVAAGVFQQRRRMEDASEQAARMAEQEYMRRLLSTPRK